MGYSSWLWACSRQPDWLKTYCRVCLPIMMPCFKDCPCKVKSSVRDLIFISRYPRSVGFHWTLLVSIEGLVNRLNSLRCSEIRGHSSAFLGGWLFSENLLRFLLAYGNAWRSKRGTPLPWRSPKWIRQTGKFLPLKEHLVSVRAPGKGKQALSLRLWRRKAQEEHWRQTVRLQSILRPLQWCLM